MVKLYGICFKYCIYCASAPSLHRESTDSLIIIIIIIIALQHSEDMDRVKDEQKLVLNEDEN